MDRSTDDEWRVRAACRDMAPIDGATESHPFYPHESEGEDTVAAKAVCAGCPVREECLEWAMRFRDHYGIWGGLTERERVSLRRRRYRAA